MKADIFDKMERILKQNSSEKRGERLGLIELYIAIIMSGVREYDLEYINSPQYYYHCYMAGLKECYISTVINYIWRKYPKGGVRGDNT